MNLEKNLDKFRKYSDLISLILAYLHGDFV